MHTRGLRGYKKAGDIIEDQGTEGQAPALTVRESARAPCPTSSPVQQRLSQAALPVAFAERCSTKARSSFWLGSRANTLARMLRQDLALFVPRVPLHRLRFVIWFPLHRQAEPVCRFFDLDRANSVPIITYICVMISRVPMSLRIPTDTKWIVLGIVAVGTLMSTLDASIVSVAMPTLTQAFSTNISVSQWFVLAYTSVVTILLLPCGKLGDIIGRRRLYISGIAIFTVGSLACAVSVSAAMLITARSVQAIGAAMMMAIGPALVTSVFPAHERGKSLGFTGSSVALGLLTGPLAGGLIIQYLSWHWLFLINIPVGLVIILAASRLHIPDRPTNTKLDLPGAALLAISIALLLAVLTLAQAHGWHTLGSTAMLVLIATSAAGFIVVERRAEEPLLRLGLFRHRDFALGALTGWANYVATSPVPVFLPFYLQHLLGCDARQTGLILAFGPLTLAIVAPIAGTASDRFGSRFFTVVGLATTSLGLLLLRQLHPSSSVADVVWRIVVMNLGSAMFVSPNSSAVFGSVRRQELGVAAGVVGLVRNLGMVCGIASAGAIITAVQKKFTATGEIGHGTAFQGLGFLAGLRTAFLLCALVAAFGAIVSALRTTPLERFHQTQRS